MENSVEDRLRALVVSRLYVEADQVTLEASFVEDLGADSLDIVDLAMAVEDEFAIQIKDEDYIHLLRMQEALAYVTARLNAPAAEPVAEASLVETPQLVQQ
jgi:acyl carrier protein